MTMHPTPTALQTELLRMALALPLHRASPSLAVAERERAKVLRRRPEPALRAVADSYCASGLWLGEAAAAAACRTLPPAMRGIVPWSALRGEDGLRRLAFMGDSLVNCSALVAARFDVPLSHELRSRRSLARVAPHVLGPCDTSWLGSLGLGSATASTVHRGELLEAALGDAYVQCDRDRFSSLLARILCEWGAVHITSLHMARTDASNTPTAPSSASSSRGPTNP
jgi:hypothetical protein